MERREEKEQRKREKQLNFQNETLKIKRVTKVTRGGRRFRFTSLVLTKNKSDKSVGYASKRGKEVITALRSSTRKAQKKEKLVGYFPSPPRTISRDVEVEYKSVIIKLRPAPPGTGIKAGSVLNNLFKLLEIKDISAKIVASHRARKNKPNIIRAAFMALDKLTGKKYNY